MRQTGDKPAAFFCYTLLMIYVIFDLLCHIRCLNDSKIIRGYPGIKRRSGWRLVRFFRQNAGGASAVGGKELVSVQQFFSEKEKKWQSKSFLKPALCWCC
jgi:hypothetical protein